MQPSPYTPGEVAHAVPGRNAELAEIDERLSYLADLHRLVGRIRIDYAPRGLGKTSLLREVQRRAEARKALTVWITAGESTGLVATIAEEIERRTARWKAAHRKGLGLALDELRVTVGVPGVQVAAGWTKDANRRRTVRQFEDVVRAAVAGARKEKRSGVVFLIDEIQEADPEGLRTLGYAWQHLQSEGADLPAAMFAAGLPNTPERIAKVVSFSERFAYRSLERLSDDAVELALVAPARALGVEWAPDALAAAVSVAQGFPYSVQLIGDATWTCAGRPDPRAVLTRADVQEARKAVRADLRALFRARWEQATGLEQNFMRAMASVGVDSVRRADIATAMGVDTYRVSVPRARLVDKGLIESSGRGEVRFTIPGFGEWVRRLRS